MGKLLEQLLDEFKNTFDQVKVASQMRELSFPSLKNKIKAAIGMRRVGKTYFLFQTINTLLQEHNIPWERILYLNFEDDRLLPCSQDQFRTLLDSFYQLYPKNHDEECYFFLDEVQNVDDWATVVRRYFDTKKIQIYLSGSSAKLLSKEISTALRGRSIAVEVWPFSFKEFLFARKIKLDDALFSKKNQDILHQNLLRYLVEGGFPEVVGMTAEHRRQVLQDYVELVVMRDIIERYNISNISLIKYIISHLLKNIGGSLSVNKFSNDIKSQGLSGAKNTIYDYLSYIEDAYLAFSVPLYSESIRKIHSNPKKIYAIDTGLSQAFSLSLNNNYGHLFENLVFLDLKRKGHKIYYYLTKERYEVDFLTEDRSGKINLYQVVWDSDDQETMDREHRALKAAEQELNIKGEIITRESYIESLWNDLKS